MIEASESDAVSVAPTKTLKVALCHDFLNQWGGAERVMTAFRDLFPDADVFCTTFDAEAVGSRIDFKPRTSFIQRLPFGSRKYKMYFWLMPFAVERFDFSDYDLVLSDSSNYIKGVRTKPPTVSVCYLHTPVRYLTFEPEYFKETAPKLLHPIMPALLRMLKHKDREAAKRPDWMIANSKTTAGRLKQFYDREADDVIFPPVDTDRFFYDERDRIEDYFLIVGRMVPYKRADLAIAAANRLMVRLKVIGGGPEDANLRKIAGPTIEFVQGIDDGALRQAYARCKALIFPQVEDAGITPLEAMACGRPVIALRKGGALESVVHGETGIFFYDQTEDSLASALEDFAKVDWDREHIRSHALKFSTQAFQTRIRENIERAMNKVRG